jgi:hypothetical protein
VSATRTERPFRATVYLPGHDEGGHEPVATKVSAATREGLEKALEPWLADGYRVKRYEVLSLFEELEP